MSVRLTKIDNLTRHEHRFLEEQDDCACLGEYTARKGYKHSETNNQIISFKIKPSIRISNPPRFKYKGQAINYWAVKLQSAMPVAEAEKGVWVPIPGSSPEGTIDFDDRLLRVLRKAYGSKVWIADLISQACARVAAHDTDERPNPAALISTWQVATGDLEVGKHNFIVFDDVLARGASFKAAKALLLRNWPGSTVRGIFLARNVHDEEPTLDFGF